MRKNHLSFIFYFVINIVIFTSRTNGDESNGNEANDEGEDEMSKLMPRRTHQHHHRFGPLSSHNKFRRDSLYSSMEQESNFNDNASGKDSSMSSVDARIRYILDNTQTRDVNGQTAVAASTTSKPTSDTFNGKLIPCFIHCSFFSLARSLRRLTKSKIYCFVFLLLSFAAIYRNRHRNRQQQQI